MTGEEVFGKRLKSARIMRGLSIRALSNVTGVSYADISKYEKAHKAPDSTAVLAFADALNQSIDYFFHPLNVKIDYVKFRKKSTLSKADENSIKGQVIDFAERYMDVESLYYVQDAVSLPKYNAATNEDAQRAANQLRVKWHLGNDGIVSVISMMEEHGVKVLTLNAASAFDGFSVFANGEYPVVVINDSFPSERKRFTMLHELAHLILTFDNDVDDKVKEKMCNAFANEFLLPSASFIAMIGEHRHDISHNELRDVQKQYGISADAQMYKAYQLGIISENRYKTYHIKRSNPAFKALIDASAYPNEMSNRFQRLVYRALCDELITMSKAASILKCSIDDVRNGAAFV